MYVSPDFNSGKFSSSCEMTITLEEHLKIRALKAEAKAWTLKAKAKDMIFSSRILKVKACPQGLITGHGLGPHGLGAPR
jgi:hypothetical protein